MIETAIFWISAAVAIGMLVYGNANNGKLSREYKEYILIFIQKRLSDNERKIQLYQGFYMDSIRYGDLERASFWIQEIKKVFEDNEGLIVIIDRSLGRK